LIKLILPNRAPTVELVIRQPQYSQSAERDTAALYKAAWATTTACPASPPALLHRC